MQKANKYGLINHQGHIKISIDYDYINAKDGMGYIRSKLVVFKGFES